MYIEEYSIVFIIYQDFFLKEDEIYNLSNKYFILIYLRGKKGKYFIIFYGILIILKWLGYVDKFFNFMFEIDLLYIDYYVMYILLFI